MDKKLKKLLDYQKFEKNKRLEKLIDKTENQHNKELSDEELGQAAGGADWQLFDK